MNVAVDKAADYVAGARESFALAASHLSGNQKFDITRAVNSMNEGLANLGLTEAPPALKPGAQDLSPEMRAAVEQYRSDNGPVAHDAGSTANLAVPSPSGDRTPS